MKKIALLTLVSVGLLTACAQDKVEAPAVEKETDVAQVSIMADGKVLEDKKIIFEEGSSLQEIMAENFDMVEEGGFITALEDIEQSESENLWWVFEVNDAQVNEGPADFIPEDEDTIAWELMAF